MSLWEVSRYGTPPPHIHRERTMTELISHDSLFKEAVRLRHICGVLYTGLMHSPCTCDSVCDDPDCTECAPYARGEAFCQRCVSMSIYESWMGEYYLEVIHPMESHGAYTPAKPPVEQEPE